MGQSGAINAKVRATKLRLNLSQRMRPIHTIGPQTHVLVCFIMFGVHMGPFCYCIKLGAKWDELVQLTQKSSCHEVASLLFTTNARETHHGTLNSCFVAYRKVWVH